MWFVESSNQSLDVSWQMDASDHNRPELNRRTSHEPVVEADGRQVVVKMRTLAAMQRVARRPDARPAPFPRTGAAKIAPALICQEDVGRSAMALEPHLELTPQRRQEHQVGVT